jgi:hypothetical protein
VASARRAAPEATRAGLVLPGIELSTFGERPAPAIPASERLKAIRAGEAAGSPAPDVATFAAGLSTAVGELAEAAWAIARCGAPVALAEGSIVGTCDDCARATPPLVALAVGPAAGTAAAACVREAAGLLAAVCRAIVDDDGPGFAAAAVCGPALVGTSPTVVTALATAVCVLRLAVGVGLLLAATAGESLAALPLVARRVGVVVEGVVAAEATCAALGSPAEGAACGVAAVCRRVAVLVGDTSAADVLAVVAAAGASAEATTFGRLGAPV